jgi:signal transduction histidine kinase
MRYFLLLLLFVGGVRMAGARPLAAPVDSVRLLLDRAEKQLLSSLPLAQRTMQQALAVARRQGQARNISLCLRRSADLSQNSGFNPEAQAVYEDALQWARRAHWVEGEGDTYLGLGQVAYNQYDFRGALRFYQQAGQAYAAVPNDSIRAYGQQVVLNNIGSTYIELHELAPAARALRQALALPRAAAHPEQMATAYYNLGDVQLAAHSPDSARVNALRGLHLAESTSDSADSYTQLAKCALALHRPTAAYPQVLQALQMARRSGYVDAESEALDVLAAALAALRRPAAYDTLRRYLALHDTLLAKDRTAAVAQAQVRFRSREQQAQIRALQQDRRLAAQAQELSRLRARQQLVGLGGLLALALALGGSLFWRYRRHQAAREMALRTRLAADLHDDVGNLLTQISMESSLLRETPHTPLETLARLESLATASRQAALQMTDVIWGLGDESLTLRQLLARMHDHAQEVLPAAGLDIEFLVPASLPDPVLPAELRHNLYLIYKEALHNVVKHAQATLVTVQLNHGPTGLVLTVADNGRGHDGAPRPGGRGLRNMQARAQAVGGSVCYLPQPTGFAVRAELPG